MSEEKVLNPATGEAFINRATDPVVSNVSTPGDFSAQFPTPLDQTEVIAMCEEVNMLRSLPEVMTGLKSYTWREMNELEFSSGSSYIAFADGACPEEYEHDGDNTTISLKNIGAKKSLTISDIMHSMASIGAGAGINSLVGLNPSSAGLPGGGDIGTFQRESIASLKEKEIKTAMTLVLNGWDRLLVEGDSDTNALEFDGIEQFSYTHTNVTSASGTFSATSFDQFLAEGCAKPTHVFGHPAAIQELMAAYFQLGFSGSQVINVPSGNRVIPGFNFAGQVNTAVGTLVVVADSNFNRNAAGASSFSASLYAMRMVHNGEPLVYKLTQIPLGLRDLAPGCTAISFQVWAKTALIVKYLCAHSKYTSVFTGRIQTTCPVVG